MNATNSKGYTLVEILIMLSITLILAEIIFALMGPARESGRRSGCFNNLHQWGTAVAMYRVDWEGMDPEKGAGLTHEQMGLPPFSYITDFEKTYKIWGTKVLWCPSTHLLPDEQKWASSYHLPLFFPEGISESSIAQSTRLGHDYPLVICEMHNIDTDFYHQPTWAKKTFRY